jgi:ribosomal protein S18 acetylase RimI-like enzyme
MYNIREGKIEDISTIVDINIKGWKLAYRDILDKDYLEKLELNREKREKGFKKLLQDGGKLIVAEHKNKVVGFATYGELRDKIIKKCGEIYAIYVDYDYQRKNIGEKLIKHAFNDMKNDFYKCIIWALQENKYKKFYDSVK